MNLIVTHQAPDLDAITSTWLLLRFDAQHFAGSRVAFVPAGMTISKEQLVQLGFTPEKIVHVDTGGGEFDHHSVERAGKQYSATKLVFDHCVRVHPELAADQALVLLVAHVTDVDHFGEAFWPEPNHPRYEFMLHNMITAMDATAFHDDANQLELGCRLLDFVYQAMKLRVRAEEEITKGVVFNLKDGGQALAIESGNDEVLLFVQRVGYLLVIKKDPQTGSVRIKVHPRAAFCLQALADKIIPADAQATWFYHPSGKMLINGSRKNPHFVPSSLSLTQLMTLVKQDY